MKGKENEIKLGDIKFQTAKQSKKPINLQQILQLTEQNQTCRMENPMGDNTDKQQERSCVKRSFDCCRRLFLYAFKNQKLAEVDVNQSQMSRLIDKLRSKKGVNIVLSHQKESKKTLVLDLDETLIHTTFKKPELYDMETEISVNGKTCIAYTVKRFGVDAFLFEMSKCFEIVVFTAGQKKYADMILNKIDPKGWISHRLYRQHCIVVNKTYYLKNLKILGRPLASLIMVDDNRMGGILQPDNFYRIQPFTGNPKDRKLVRLGNFLKYLNDFSDIRPITSYKKKYQQRQIKLKQNLKQNVVYLNESLSVDQKRKIYKHKKKNSQIQSLTEKDQNQCDSQNQHENTNTNLVVRPI